MSKLHRYAIVYVDDEAMSLKYFEKEFSKDFNVHTAVNAADGWDLLQKHQSDVGILMSDQRMPGQSGVQLLEKARHHFPHIIRILVTAYSDIDSAVAGVNVGAIYKYISKPWDVTDLRFTLLRALEFCELLRERDHLLREKLSVLQQIVLCDRAKNLGVLASGLSSHFRNAMRAANAFVAAIPQGPGLAAIDTASRADKGKNIEWLLRHAGSEILHIAEGMKKIAEAPPYFSASPTPLAALLKPLIQSGGAVSSPTVSIKINPSLPAIKANQNQIVKLFSILAANIEAVAEAKSPVRIEATEASQHEGGAMVKFQISDDGPDWSPDQHVRFFAPFPTFGQDPGQLGLELAMAYFIAHHHGGRVSIPGAQKERVTVELPIDPAATGIDAMQGSHLLDLFQREFGLS